MAKRSRPRKVRRKTSATSESDQCILAKPLTSADVSDLILHDGPPHDRDSVREYVELEAQGERVTHAECLKREVVLRTEHQVWDVTTDKDRYWVVTSPTNLYSHAHFPSADYALSFHVGLWLRTLSRKPKRGGGDEQEHRTAASWRRLQQATEALDAAREAEDFQAVGMRCRECLLQLARDLASIVVIDPGAEAPKRGDFIAWTHAIAGAATRDGSAEELRTHLRTLAKTTWQYVNWLTHARGATYRDADVAVDSSDQVVSLFGAAVIRQERGIPNRCPRCASYQLDSVYRPDREGPDTYVTVCRHCGWEASESAH